MGGYGVSVQQVPILRPSPWESPPQWGTQVIQGQWARGGAENWGLGAGKHWRTSGRLPGEGKAWGIPRSEEEGRQRSRKGEPPTQRRDDRNSVDTEDGGTEPAWLPGGEREADLLLDTDN